jgi:anti-anti-sigma factor
MAEVEGFAVSSASTPEGARFVRVVGELDAATAVELRQVLDSAIGDGAHEVQVDLARVAFMDSSGLAVIVDAHRRLVANGGRVQVCAASAIVGKVIDIAGLSPDLL